ncbi:transcription/translation regulatory transformer protein RfaH [Thorsellia anophelis]|uniref:Transcription antitermination protein RfaH n=1 Tax=Thorsellia anophelis DSM 18579 TaxID=1123402 RepID=A0A1I0CHX4_9GAMM|nr:transcription/translation regulatory transformer protein RfaH [Thorsellia anophelis]SET19129.1 transcriptional antiterminator RfaH [Thorsellia anophelis DSM 18579]
MKSWYLIYCKRGQIERAATHLEQQLVNCFFPTFETEKIIRGKRQVVNEPLFPNYLFIQFNPEEIHTTTISGTRGVSYFIRNGLDPAIVPDSLIEGLKIPKEVFIENSDLPKQGETVTITSGVFKGLEAIYHEQNGEMRSVLLVKMLGKDVRKIIDNTDFDKKNELN